MEKARRDRIVVCATVEHACRLEHRSATGLPFSTVRSWGVCLPLEMSAFSWQGVAPAEAGFESTHVLEARLRS